MGRYRPPEGFTWTPDSLAAEILVWTRLGLDRGQDEGVGPSPAMREWLSDMAIGAGRHPSAALGAAVPDAAVEMITVSEACGSLCRTPRTVRDLALRYGWQRGHGKVARSDVELYLLKRQNGTDAAAV